MKMTSFSQDACGGIREAIAAHRDRLAAVEFGIGLAKTPADVIARVNDLDLIARAMMAGVFAEAANIAAAYAIITEKDSKHG